MMKNKNVYGGGHVINLGIRGLGRNLFSLEILYFK